MISVVLLSGLLVGLLASGLVFADTTRRNLALRVRCLWAGSVGIVSLGGPLLGYVFDDLVYRQYFGLGESPAIAPLPREVAGAVLGSAFIAGGVAVLAYGFASRYEPLKMA